MPSPSPLPLVLRDTSFTVAAARAEGVGRGRLRRNDLVAPFHGARSPAADLDPRRRAEALLALLGPGAVLSHLTAARLWPLELPDAAPEEGLHVSVRAPARAPRRPRVVGHAISDPLVRRTVRWGLPMTDPASLWCHLGALLELDDLVAVGDALVRVPVREEDGDPRPWVTLRELTARSLRFEGRGAVQVRRAIDLVRDGADSRQETRFRLACIRAGLPEPQLQVPIRFPSGLLAGYADGWYEHERVAWEYKGDGHRTSDRRFARDIGRYDDFASLGIRTVRIVKSEFLPYPERSVERLRRALAERAGGGDRR
ncbi:hypothetical protein B0T42_13675 [Rathayibacter sp. VKM Ac-2630]|nr:hypothetical protein B0T42_13675 [Rathayibacter sp. VKM Ac-2630]